MLNHNITLIKDDIEVCTLHCHSPIFNGHTVDISSSMARESWSKVNIQEIQFSGDCILSDGKSTALENQHNLSDPELWEINIEGMGLYSCMLNCNQYEPLNDKSGAIAIRVIGIEAVKLDSPTPQVA